MARFPLLRPAGAIIDNFRLGAYIEAEMWSVVHDGTLTDTEKVAGLHALASLARSLSDHWRNINRYHGDQAERLWFRMCGLAGDGMPTPEMVRRIAELDSQDGSTEGVS